jgi:hypothetical protein
LCFNYWPCVIFYQRIILLLYNSQLFSEIIFLLSFTKIFRFWIYFPLQSRLE